MSALVLGKLSLRPLSNHVTKVSAVYNSTPAPAVPEADVTDVEITNANPKPFSEMPGKLTPSSAQILLG